MISLPTPTSTQQLTTFNRSTSQKTIFIARGSRITIGEVTGAGAIAQLWMTFPGWFWQHWSPESPVSQTILKTLILRIYFDGAEEPQVAAPVGDFFGIGLCEVASFASRYFGMSSGGFYCSFPMPFKESFRIEVENLDSVVDTDVFMNVLYQLADELPPEIPFFHAYYHSGGNPGSESLVIADVEGNGKYVGCTLACQGAPLNYLSFLEAPENVFIDDDWASPRIIGTGLEDYFLGGWYFREGAFAGPYHGVPLKDTLRSSVAMYRIHENDAIHFSRRLKFIFQNPWNPDRLKPFRHSSVAFLYIDKPTPAPPIPPSNELLNLYRIRDCDHQSIP
jgi:hypothetical protein